MTEEPRRFTKTLSASRIKTFKSCSWLYHYKYNLRLIDPSNKGAMMGSCAHAIYEVLGNLKHVHHYYSITHSETVMSSPAITRMLKIHMRKYGLEDELFDLLDKMIVNGLKHDFFGHDHGTVTDSYSELDFVLEKFEEDKKYRIQGFIDKLFLYKDKKTALIRDFKTSKSVFEGDDVTDNIQDQVYRLAVKEKFPWVKKINVEFLFVKPEHVEAERHVVKTPHCGEGELGKLESKLTEVQNEVEAFDDDAAISRLAAFMGRPAKEEGFCKSLLCGFAKEPGQLKKDGTPYFACVAKFPYDYYALYNDKKEKVQVSKEKSDLVKLKQKGWKIKKEHYAGCPAHNGKANYNSGNNNSGDNSRGFDFFDF